MADVRAADFFPTRFSGEDIGNPYAHWLAYNDYAVLQDFDDNQKLNRFKTSLTGRARLWIEGKDFQNVNDMKRSFLEQFSGMRTRAGTAEMFRNSTFKSGESMETYLARLKQLANQLNYGNDLIKDQFLAGLPKEIRVAASMSGGDDLDELVSAAQKYADLSGMNTTKEVSFALPISDEVEQLRAEIEQLKVNKSKDDRSRSRSGDRKSRYNSYDRQARYNSKDREGRSLSRERSRERQYSHSRGRAPHRSSTFNHRSYYRPTNKTCDFCKQRGHLWRQCRQLQAEMRRSNNGRQDF